MKIHYYAIPLLLLFELGAASGEDDGMPGNVVRTPVTGAPRRSSTVSSSPRRPSASNGTPKQALDKKGEIIFWKYPKSKEVLEIEKDIKNIENDALKKADDKLKAVTKPYKAAQATYEAAKKKYEEAVSEKQNVVYRIDGLKSKIEDVKQAEADELHKSQTKENISRSKQKDPFYVAKRAFLRTQNSQYLNRLAQPKTFYFFDIDSGKKTKNARNKSVKGSYQTVIVQPCPEGIKLYMPLKGATYVIHSGSTVTVVKDKSTQKKKCRKLSVGRLLGTKLLGETFNIADIAELKKMMLNTKIPYQLLFYKHVEELMKQITKFKHVQNFFNITEDEDSIYKNYIESLDTKKKEANARTNQ